MKTIAPIPCRFVAVLLAIATLALTTSPASACTLPVFRYALERWAPTPLELVVYHRGPIAADDQRRLDAINPRDVANLYISYVDVLTATPEDLAGWNARPKSAGDGPWLVVRYGEREDFGRIWAGTIPQLPAHLMDSPARQTITRDLCRGESVVWVFVETGNPTVDAAAMAVLERSLEQARSRITLPEQAAPEDADPSSRMRAAPPLRLSFSIVRVRADDPAEATLVAMLRESDRYHLSDTVEPSTQPASRPATAAVAGPAVYAVFGRGRVLWGLMGPTLNPEQIFDVASFLSSACSCQVKELNPGIDLLLSQDWETALFSEAPPEPVPATRPEAQWVASASLPATGPTQPPAATRPAASVAPVRQNWRVYGLIASVAMMIVAAGGWAVLRLRARAN